MSDYVGTNPADHINDDRAMNRQGPPIGEIDMRVQGMGGILDAYTSGPGAWDHLDHGSPSATTNVKGAPFSTPNRDAFPTHQRKAQDWWGSTVYVGNEQNQQQPTKVADRQPGRDWILLFVPPNAPAGIQIASSDSALESIGIVMGFQVPIGFAITLDTEGPIWAVSLVAGADTFVSVAVGTNPS